MGTAIPMQWQMQERRSWCRLFAAAIAVVFAAQVLLGSSLHVHTLADCESAAAVHWDYHKPVETHPDQVDITPDKLVKSFADSAELPALLFIALLMLVWPRLHEPWAPLPDDGPPLKTRYALRPLTRAPPPA